MYDARMPKTYTITLPGKSPVTLTAAGGFCAPCEAQTLQEQTAAVQATYQNNTVAPGPVAMSPTTDAAWSGPIGFEGEFTGDGRYIVQGALYWDAQQFPLPLRWAAEDVGAHGGAQVIGLIETLERREGGSLWGSGIIDLSTEMGQRVYAGLQKGTIRGVSMDLDDTELELRVKAEVYAEYKSGMEAFMDDLMGAGKDDDDKADPIAESEDENGYVKVDEYATDDEVMYITKSRVRAATIVDIPAFANAYVELVGDTVNPAGLTAAGTKVVAPVNPPSAWFENPVLSEATPMTFSEDGRVVGHIALWGTCHTQWPGACVTPPFSRTNYSLFRTGVLHTSDGKEVAVGHLSMDTGHAEMGMGYAPAASHYDNTGTVMADLSCGEDAFGIWVSGALRPGVSAEKMRALRAAPMSGDWREVGGNLELLHILAVNLPGFPVPRTKAIVASGRTTALIIPIEEVVMAEAETVKPLSKVEIFAARSQKLAIDQWAAEVGE